jgi:hypothetical protein
MYYSSRKPTSKVLQYISQLIWEMLEVDWRQRPSAQDILDLLFMLTSGVPNITVVNTEKIGNPRETPLKCSELIAIEPCFEEQSEDWKFVQWALYWYVIDTLSKDSFLTGGRIDCGSYPIFSEAAER